MKVSIKISPEQKSRDQGNPTKLATGNAQITVLNYANPPTILFYLNSPSPALAVTVNVGSFIIYSVYHFTDRIA
jgi:hypothetical protein